MHRIVPLFDPTMILFYLIVEVFICSMVYLTTSCLTSCSGRGGMPIRRHVFRIMADDADRLPEKTLCCLHIPRFAQERIHHIAIVINGSIEIAPLPMDFDGGFINVARFPCLPMPLSSQLVCKQRGKSSFPISDRLMSEGPPARQKHFGHITKTQFGA